MRYFFLQILVLIFCKVYSQSKNNISIDYKLYYTDDESYSVMQKFAPDAKNQSGKVIFKLLINDSCSYFQENNGINGRDLSFMLAMNKIHYSMPIYTSQSQKKLFYKNNPNFIFFGNDEFVIYKDYPTGWNLSNESKIVENKVCYKATCKDYYIKKSKKILYDVIAWYCPQLPYNFGPTFYSGLPGLILEINYLNSTLTATKISFDYQDKLFVKPSGFKLVSTDEYERLKNLKTIEIFNDYEQFKNNKPK